MPTWAWIVIAAGAVVLAGLLALTVWRASARRRTGRLRGQFGPEYDRTIERTRSKRHAEAELAARQERHERLQLRPLSRASRERYLDRWQAVQAEFVDDPRTAISGADSLIQLVMAERGYPVEDFDQRAADISVDHPQVVEHYRRGHSLAQASADGDDSTESLRQAMRHYRALFDDLVEPDGEAPGEREDAATAKVVRR